MDHYGYCSYLSYFELALCSFLCRFSRRICQLLSLRLTRSARVWWHPKTSRRSQSQVGKYANYVVSPCQFQVGLRVVSSKTILDHPSPRPLHTLLDPSWRFSWAISIHFPSFRLPLRPVTSLRIQWNDPVDWGSPEEAPYWRNKDIQWCQQLIWNFIGTVVITFHHPSKAICCNLLGTSEEKPQWNSHVGKPALSWLLSSTAGELATLKSSNRTGMGTTHLHSSQEWIGYDTHWYGGFLEWGYPKTDGL